MDVGGVADDQRDAVLLLGAGGGHPKAETRQDRTQQTKTDHPRHAPFMSVNNQHSTSKHQVRQNKRRYGQ
jgi:hypothetical protein